MNAPPVASHQDSDADDVMAHHRSHETLSHVMESPRSEMHKKAARILMHPFFDYTMGLIIVFNMLVMIIETDRTASEDKDSSAIHWTDIIGEVLLGIFIVELLFRMYVEACHFWKDKWNVFDFLIVAVDAGFSVLGKIIGDIFPASMLRIFRLAKLARVSKVLRVFPELRLLLAGLLGSFSAIFWGTVLLAIFLLVWSMIAVLFIHPINKDIDYGDCTRCPRAYESVLQASLTFWQQIVAGDSWGQVTVPVIEEAPPTAIFFILLFLTVGMAVINLILGVVVSVAQSASDQLQHEDQTEKTLIKLEKQTHLLNLCKALDTGKSGQVTKRDVFKRFDEPGEFRDSILHMEITREDFDIIWTICDADRKGVVPYKDFVNHIYAIRNSDSSFMLSYIKYYITLIRNTLIEKMDTQHNLQIGIERRVEEQVRRVEQMEEKILGIHRTVTSADLTSMTIRRSDEYEREGGSCSQFEDDRTNTAPLVTTSPVQSLDNEGANAHSENVVASTKMNADTQIWLKRLCRDIGSLQVELKGAVADMNHKFASSIKEDLAMAKEPAGLAVAPGSVSVAKLFPTFCRTTESSDILPPRATEMARKSVTSI